MSQHRVAVIGGGLAGLAAAVRLGDNGVDVELLERAPRLGGATWSFARDGLHLDNGQHVFMRCCTEYLAFLERIGSRDKVVLQDRLRVPVARPGGPKSDLARTGWPSPLHLSSSLRHYAHLGWRARLSVVRTALKLRALDLEDPNLDSQSFGFWLRGHGADRDAVEAIWNLVCLPTVNLTVDDASLVLAAKVFRTGLLDTNDGADIGWAAVPLQELHGSAASTVLNTLGATVELSAHVDHVTANDGGGFTVSLADRMSEVDAVVVAVPHTAVDALLPAGTFEQQGTAADLGRSPIVNVHLVWDRRVLHDPLLAGLGSPVQFVFDRTDSSGVAHPQQCLAISLSAADPWLSWSADELIEHFADAIRELLPAASAATLVKGVVTREVAATFRGIPGSARLRPGTATNVPGISLAGAWTDTAWPATMEGAVMSGNTAAAATMGYLETIASARTSRSVSDVVT